MNTLMTTSFLFVVMNYQSIFKDLLSLLLACMSQCLTMSDLACNSLLSF